MIHNEDLEAADAHADRELELADRARRAEWDEAETAEMHKEAYNLARLRSRLVAAIHEEERHEENAWHLPCPPCERLAAVVLRVFTEDEPRVCPTCGFTDPWAKYRWRPGGPCMDLWHGQGGF